MPNNSSANQGSGCTVLVFSRAPIPGHAKTRLIPSMGAVAAAQLQQRMTEAVVQTAVAAKIGQVILCVIPHPDHPSFAALVSKYNISLAAQQGETLGQRMYAALSGVLSSDGCYALLIGSDCPEMSTNTLRTAYHQLRDGADIVMAPAVDGGYVLIGARNYCPAVFNGIDWGSERVMAQTCKQIQGLGIRYAELPLHHDIDRPADLEQLRGSTLWDARYAAALSDAN